MTIQKKILLAVILGLALYGGIYVYALNSEAFRYVEGALENSHGIAQRVGTGVKVTLPLFRTFKEKHVNSNETVTMTVTVAGSIESIPVFVRASRKNGLWKIEYASTGGVAIDFN